MKQSKTQASLLVQNNHTTEIRVLIVDDSPYNLFVLKELLLKISPNIKITESLNGEDAINKVRDYNTNPFDFILMDLQMPVMTGPQVNISQIII